MNTQIKKIFAQMGISLKHIQDTHPPKKYDVFFTLGELMKAKSFIDFIPMMFQRGFISDQDFVDGIVTTLLKDNASADIPQMHLRLFSNKTKSLSFDFKTLNVFAQILDGLQRSWTMVHAMHEVSYTIPKGIIVSGGGRHPVDLGGLTFVEFEAMYEELYAKKVTNRILQYSCYLDITDEEATYLFSDVLNFNNVMNAQMIRNSSTMPLPRTIATAVRLNSYGAYDSSGYYDSVYAKMNIKRFDVFEYRSNPNGTKVYTFVDFGNEKLDQEEAVAQCHAFFLTLPGTKHPLDKMYKDAAYNMMDRWPEFEKRFLEWSEIIKSLVRPEQISKIKFLKGFCFYCELCDSQVKINTRTKFLSTYLKTWDRLMVLSEKEKIAKSPKSRFALNNNKDATTAETVLQLMEELYSNPTEWGCSIVDKKRTFTDTASKAALSRQDYICPRCEEKIDYRNKADGHLEMHAYGGSTNDENLIVLHTGCNATDHFTGEMK